MKKFIFAFAIIGSALAFAPTTFAQSTPNISLPAIDTTITGGPALVPIGKTGDPCGLGCASGYICDTSSQTCSLDTSVNLNTTPGVSNNQSTLNSAIQTQSNNAINGTYTCTPVCTTGYTCTPGTLGNTCVQSAAGVSQQINTSINNAVSQTPVFFPLAPIPGLTQGITADATGIPIFLNNLYKFLIGIAAALAVIMIVWGGLEISTQDSVSKHADGVKRIEGAIFGLVLVLSPVLVFSIINPAILNLSLSMPPLNTKSGTWTSSATVPALPSQLADNQQVSLCSDDASCQAAADACAAKGGSPSAKCSDPSGNLHAISYVAVARHVVGDAVGGLVPGAGYWTTGTHDPECAESNQSLRMVCTDATSAVTGAQGATGGNIINGPYAYYVRFTGSDAQTRAQTFACPISGQPVTSYSLTNSAQITNWYAICYLPKFTHIYNSQPTAVSAASADENIYKQQCSDLGSKPRENGASSSTHLQTFNPVVVACDQKNTIPGYSVCYQSSFGCVFTN